MRRVQVNGPRLRSFQVTFQAAEPVMRQLVSKHLVHGSQRILVVLRWPVTHHSLPLNPAHQACHPMSHGCLDAAPSRESSAPALAAQGRLARESRNHITRNARSMNDDGPEKPQPIEKTFACILKIAVVSGLRIIAQRHQLVVTTFLPGTEQSRAALHQQHQSLNPLLVRPWKKRLEAYVGVQKAPPLLLSIAQPQPRIPGIALV